MSPICRRTEPYSMRIDYRRAVNTGATAAQAAIIRRVLANGHKVETDKGEAVKEARSDGGVLQIRINGSWKAAPIYFVHP